MSKKREDIKTIILNAGEMKGKKEIHEYFIEKFDLPSYYGKNLDALWDILSERSEITHIIIQGADELLENLGDYGSAILDLFEDLEYEYDNYYLEIK